jgi:hypothetical protein
MSAIIRREKPEVDIDVYVEDQQAYWKKDRDRLAKQRQFTLVECSYSPTGTFFKDTPTVSLHVYGIPTEEWKKCGITNDHLIQILEEHISSISVKQGWAAGWRLEINWSGLSSEVQYSSVINAGTRSKCSISRSLRVKHETL